MSKKARVLNILDVTIRKCVTYAQGEVKEGEGIVVAVEEIVIREVNPFYPFIVVQFEDIPRNEEWYKITVASGGKLFIVYKKDFFPIGSIVKVKFLQRKVLWKKVIGIEKKKSIEIMGFHL